MPGAGHIAIACAHTSDHVTMNAACNNIIICMHACASAAAWPAVQAVHTIWFDCTGWIYYSDLLYVQNNTIHSVWYYYIIYNNYIMSKKIRFKRPMTKITKTKDNEGDCYTKNICQWIIIIIIGERKKFDNIFATIFCTYFLNIYDTHKVL